MEEDENTATSAHLDSYVHVYDNGSTARLHVDTWDRNTVADGYWQTVNTIQPLINRDVYLADAIDRLAEKYTVYTEGDGIKIIENAEPPSSYTISMTDDYWKNIPKYEFDERYFAITTDDLNVTKVGLKIAENDRVGYLSADEYGLHANYEKLMHDTSGVTSHSAYSAHHVSAHTYTYNSGTLNYEYRSSLPNPNELENKLYIIG